MINGSALISNGKYLTLLHIYGLKSVRCLWEEKVIDVLLIDGVVVVVDVVND